MNFNREGVDIHHLEPQEKADMNNYIKTIHKNHPANLTNICKECHKEFTKNKQFIENKNNQRL